MERGILLAFCLIDVAVFIILAMFVSINRKEDLSPGLGATLHVASFCLAFCPFLYWLGFGFFVSKISAFKTSHAKQINTLLRLHRHATRGLCKSQGQG